jgi:hypothetical protein
VFTLTSIATVDLNVTISPHPSLVPASLPASLREQAASINLLQFVTVREQEGSDQPAPAQFDLPAGGAKNITVTVRIPSASSSFTVAGTSVLLKLLRGVRFNLSVEASAPGVPSVTQTLPVQQISKV